MRFRRWGSSSLRELFQVYYSLDPPLLLPADIVRREFAFQPFEIESYVRHISFPDEQSLRQYLRTKVPRQAYHSVAIYQLPEAPQMEEKGWLGSELLFDLDLDHTEFCQQGLVDDECLVKGFAEARKVAIIVEKVLGGKALPYFTGHRGFHVRAKCPDCMTLGRDERREIAKLVRAEGLDLSLLTPKPPLRPLRPSPDEPGWRGLLAELYPELLRPINWREEVLQVRLGVDIDAMVTEDPSRLTRIPGTLNGKGALLVVPLCPHGIFNPGSWLSPFKGELEGRALKPLEQTKVLGYTVGLSPGEEVNLPAGPALYLALEGYIELEGGDVVVRRDTGWWPIQGCDWTP